MVATHAFLTFGLTALIYFPFGFSLKVIQEQQCLWSRAVALLLNVGVGKYLEFVLTV